MRGRQDLGNDESLDNRLSETLRHQRTKATLDLQRAMLASSVDRGIRSHTAVRESANTRIAFSSAAKRTTLREPEVVRATFIHERKCARRGAQDVFAEIIFSLARTELRAIQPTDRISRVVQ